MKKKIICIIIVILILISFIATVSIEWLYLTFENLSMEEIVFHLKVSMDGTNSDMIFLYLRQCVPIILISTITILFVLLCPILTDIKIKERIIRSSKNKKIIWINLILAILIFVTSIIRIINVTDIVEYFKNQSYISKFIENEYVDPEYVKVEFPENKRNLIYIYLESMESTFYSKEKGGFLDESLIPELEKLAEENLNFSNSDKLGGSYALYGSTWTAGAMASHTLGLPLKFGITLTETSFDSSKFLSGSYGIGEILEENGYKNFLMLGSDADFADRRKLYEQHGNYEIWDYNSAVKEGKVDNFIWWGYNDDLLFKFAKEKLTELSNESEPFNFTMLTADTHFPDGFKCVDCENKWDKQYKNVISCSSKKVGEFIEWIKKQDFYENTTIVIVGDHLTMQTNFIETPEGYDKTALSIIINPAIKANNTKNRKYYSMDFLPTTIAALGAKIEGERLALGTNLFSNEPTLLEKYGIEYVEEELKKNSDFYYDYIILGNKKNTK